MWGSRIGPATSRTDNVANRATLGSRPQLEQAQRPCPSGVTYDYDFAVTVVKAAVATLATQAVIVSPDDPNHVEREPISTQDDAHEVAPRLPPHVPSSKSWKFFYALSPRNP
jgi:hypothetical protein